MSRLNIPGETAPPRQPTTQTLEVRVGRPDDAETWRLGQAGRDIPEHFALTLPPVQMQLGQDPGGNWLLTGSFLIPAGMFAFQLTKPLVGPNGQPMVKVDEALWLPSVGLRVMAIRTGLSEPAAEHLNASLLALDNPEASPWDGSVSPVIEARLPLLGQEAGWALVEVGELADFGCNDRLRASLEALGNGRRFRTHAIYGKKGVRRLTIDFDEELAPPQES